MSDIERANRIIDSIKKSDIPFESKIDMAFNIGCLVGFSEMSSCLKIIFEMNLPEKED